MSQEQHARLLLPARAVGLRIPRAMGFVRQVINCYGAIPIFHMKKLGPREVQFPAFEDK